MCAALGVVALLTNTPSVTCTRFLEFGRANDIGATVIVLAAWALVLWWVWMRDGAGQMAEVANALAVSSGSHRRFSRRLFALALTVGLLAIPALQLLLPPIEPPDPLCLP